MLEALIDIAFKHRQSLGRIQQLQGPKRLTPWSSIPFKVRQPVDTFLLRYLSVYASTYLLPDTLQHLILGLCLTATQVGVTPTYLQAISSTHMQFFVLIIYCCVSPVSSISWTIGRTAHPTYCALCVLSRQTKRLYKIGHERAQRTQK